MKAGGTRVNCIHGHSSMWARLGPSPFPHVALTTATAWVLFPTQSPEKTGHFLPPAEPSAPGPQHKSQFWLSLRAHLHGEPRKSPQHNGPRWVSGHFTHVASTPGSGRLGDGKAESAGTHSSAISLSHQGTSVCLWVASVHVKLGTSVDLLRAAPSVSDSSHPGVTIKPTALRSGPTVLTSEGETRGLCCVPCIPVITLDGVGRGLDTLPQTQNATRPQANRKHSKV